ncbi:MAG: hypothetical protein Q4F35_06870 [Akkermansia sp.]|nr:hypothetical protein [Akkermansia sp.]
MGRQRKKSGKARSGQEVTVKGLGTPQANMTGNGGNAPVASYTQNNVQFNQNLMLPDNCITALQAISTLPPTMHAEAMEMAKKEQAHRHMMEEADMQKYYELSSAKQKLDDGQVTRSQRFIFWSEMVGKIFGSIVIGGIVYSILRMAMEGNYKGVAVLAGVSVVLGGGICWLARLLMKNANTATKN